MGFASSVLTRAASIMMGSSTILRHLLLIAVLCDPIDVQGVEEISNGQVRDQVYPVKCFSTITTVACCA